MPSIIKMMRAVTFTQFIDELNDTELIGNYFYIKDISFCDFTENALLHR